MEKVRTERRGHGVKQTENKNGVTALCVPCYRCKAETCRFVEEEKRKGRSNHPLFEKTKKRNRSSEARMLYKKTNQMGFFFFPVKPH